MQNLEKGQNLCKTRKTREKKRKKNLGKNLGRVMKIVSTALVLDKRQKAIVFPNFLSTLPINLSLKVMLGENNNPGNWGFISTKNTWEKSQKGPFEIQCEP